MLSNLFQNATKMSEPPFERIQCKEEKQVDKEDVHVVLGTCSPCERTIRSQRQRMPAILPNCITNQGGNSEVRTLFLGLCSPARRTLRDAYMYMYMHIYIHTHIYIYMYMYVCIHVYIHICMICMHACIYVYIHIFSCL